MNTKLTTAVILILFTAAGTAGASGDEPDPLDDRERLASGTITLDRNEPGADEAEDADRADTITILPGEFPRFHGGIWRVVFTIQADSDGYAIAPLTTYPAIDDPDEDQRRYIERLKNRRFVQREDLPGWLEPYKKQTVQSFDPGESIRWSAPSPGAMDVRYLYRLEHQLDEDRHRFQYDLYIQSTMPHPPQ